MSAHKNIDRICVFILALTVVVTVLFCNGKSLGIGTTGYTMGYENRLFDHSKVHKIDIVMDDWNDFIENCDDELYRNCNVVIDGEAIKNVAIRAKGNTSLDEVKKIGSSRYSFKIEFDRYENGKTYHGLDKLCLNNTIQDNTYMKDYLAYTLMNDFGVDAPLCSYVDIHVNGEEFGLYLAVEAVEDSFLERNYGKNHGELYKPESGEVGSFADEFYKKSDEIVNEFFSQIDEEKLPDDNAEDQTSFMDNTGVPETMLANFDMSKLVEIDKLVESLGGLGSDDVKLKYIDENIDSYSFIFDNAKTKVDKADKKRLIRSIKALNEQRDLDETVDIDEVIKYFVVNGFLCNYDSYTGKMIHNYYLYEKNGRLSMIPWDYNLAYATFSLYDTEGKVNSPIDSPALGDINELPMISWIFDNEEYTEKYHQYYREFADSTDFDRIISDTKELIDDYVEKDATKFITVKQFEKGVSAIGKYCQLRTESVQGQLDGSIPSTKEGQNNDNTAFIDTSSLKVEDMGAIDPMANTDNAELSSMIIPNGFDIPEGFSIPEGAEIPEGLGIPEGFSIPEGAEIPEGFDIPEGFSIPEGAEIPEGFDIPEGLSGMGDIPAEKMPEAEKTDTDKASDEDGKDKEKKEYILLGSSAFILLFGLGFALKFKR